MSRGRQKANVRDISRQSPTKEETDKVREAISQAVSPPIVVAILGAAYLEHELESALRPRFKRNTDTDWARLTGDRGPLETLAAKITAAYGFGIIDDTTRKNLMIVKDIRNAFAHSKKLIDFDQEGVVEELNDVRLSSTKKRSELYKALSEVRTAKFSPRTRFIVLCLWLGNQMMRRERDRLRAQARHYRRKARKQAKQSPFFGALTNALNDPKAMRGLYGGIGGGLFGGTFLGGPTPLNQTLAGQGILGAWLPPDDNKDSEK